MSSAAFPILLSSWNVIIGQRVMRITVLVSLLLPLLSSFYTRNNITLNKPFKRTWNALSPYSVSHDLQKRILTRLAFLREPGSTCQTLYIWTSALWRLATSFRYVREFLIAFNCPRVFELFISISATYTIPHLSVD